MVAALSINFAMKKMAKIGLFTDWYCPVEIRKECPFLT